MEHKDYEKKNHAFSNHSALTGYRLLAYGLGLCFRWELGESGARPPARKTLRDIGRERDFESEVAISDSNTEYADLRLLAKHSDAVVIGRINEEASAFDGDDDIFTTYIVDVNRVVIDKTAKVLSILKLLGEHEPPAPLSAPLKVVRSGGVVTINGHRVAKTMRGSEGLKAGKHYILFLQWSRAFKAYRLAGGMSGAVLVDSELVVKPLGSAKGVRIHNGTALEPFLQDLLTDQ